MFLYVLLSVYFCDSQSACKIKYLKALPTKWISTPKSLYICMSAQLLTCLPVYTQLLRKWDQKAQQQQQKSVLRLQLHKSDLSWLTFCVFRHSKSFLPHTLCYSLWNRSEEKDTVFWFSRKVACSAAQSFPETFHGRYFFEPHAEFTSMEGSGQGLLHRFHLQSQAQLIVRISWKDSLFREIVNSVGKNIMIISPGLSSVWLEVGWEENIGSDETGNKDSVNSSLDWSAGCFDLIYPMYQLPVTLLEFREPMPKSRNLVESVLFTSLLLWINSVWHFRFYFLKLWSSLGILGRVWFAFNSPYAVINLPVNSENVPHLTWISKSDVQADKLW